MNTVAASLPTRDEAMATAAAEYAALVSMLQGLEVTSWSQPTDCPPWTVRDLVAHVTGAAEEAVRLRVQLRHLRGARARAGASSLVDALNDQQLADRVGAGPTQLLAELTDLAAKAPRGRRRTPWFIRRRPLPGAAGGLPGDTMGYLLDVIYTRDIWMHRIDISRATGCDLPASGGEGTVIGQIVRDLDRGWTAEPFVLSLHGAVTGSWPIGPTSVASGSTRIELDTVAACRLWSGRGDETGLRGDDTVTQALRDTRIVF